MKEYLIDDLPRQAADWVPKVGSALLILFVFWLLAVVTRKVVRKGGVAAGIDSSVINLLARSAHVLLLVIGLVTTLGTLGIDVSAIVASLGLTGFAVGFALKDSISNLLSGVLILIHRPFKVGDTIKIKTNKLPGGDEILMKDLLQIAGVDSQFQRWHSLTLGIASGR